MAGSIFIAEPEIRVDETAGTVTQRILRSGSLDGAVTITYGLTGDTATAGQDFDGGRGTVTMPAGASEVSVPVGILDDGLGEATEVFVFSLISARGADLSAPRTSRISILDDETPAPPPDDEPPMQSDYTATPVPLVTGLDQPIRLEFSPLDPSMAYVAEKPGVIRVADLDTGESSVMLDISDQVNDRQDRGLLDIALHPNFAVNGLIYAFVVVDPAATARLTGNAGQDGGGNRFSHLLRFKADPDTGFTSIVEGSERILLGRSGRTLADISGRGREDFTDPDFAGEPSSERYINRPAQEVIAGIKQDYLKMDSLSHAGGGLIFGPDRKLYVSVGDGTSFNYADPRSPDTLDLDSLSGKILRINPNNGRGLPDNPYVDDGVELTSNRAKVFQSGLRNPFSLAFDEEGRLFITNTGWDTYEMIDNGGPGAVFGWPYYEGGDGGVLRKANGYRDFPSASAFYSAVASGEIDVVPPFRAFAHASAASGFQVQAITGGSAIYQGGPYPAAFDHDLFFSDFSGGEVYTVDTKDRTELKFLYRTSDGAFAPVDYVAKDGLVYYVDLAHGHVGYYDITEGAPPQGPHGSATIGSGPDSLVLRISQDAYLGDAQYTITVDGVQINGVITAEALRGSGLADTVTVRGAWAAGDHEATINFLNDAWGGTPDTDRNLYIESGAYNGTAVAGASAMLGEAGPYSFTFTEASPIA